MRETQMIGSYVAKETHERFRALAKAKGLTASKLLIHLIEEDTNPADFPLQTDVPRSARIMLGGYVPPAIKTQLQKSAQQNHRTVSDELERLLDEALNGPQCAICHSRNNIQVVKSLKLCNSCYDEFRLHFTL